jgi:hypothetical protein
MARAVLLPILWILYESTNQCDASVFLGELPELAVITV